MSPKKFDWQERETARIKMLEIGTQLLREHGMTHTSVERVTAAVGLGKSTFYSFFPSKERFVYEIILHSHAQVQKQFEQKLAGRERLSNSEARDYLRRFFQSDQYLEKYFSHADYEKLRAALPPECGAVLEAESQLLSNLLSRMENVRPDLDMHLISNLTGVITLAQKSSDALFEDALEQTLDKLYELLLSNIFADANEPLSRLFLYSRR